MGLILSCIEPFETSEDFFEDVLIINARITNENKNQEITLNRSFRLGSEISLVESNATVIIIGSNGNTFTFLEKNLGKYLSTVPFAALEGVSYTLQITTESGQKYASQTMELPVANTIIENIIAKKTVDTDGNEGIGIFLNTNDVTNNSKLYRYEFEETFKIIAPFWSPFDAVFRIEGANTIDVDIILREQEEQTCYGTSKSKDIILNSTLGFNDDKIEDFNVLFLTKNDYKLLHRYSILVKQYVQTPLAFSYYETLKGLSKSEGNAFSEDQPGFILSNVFSVDNPNENVAGLFEVTAVDEKRIFFNFQEFFPGEELPPYISDCSFFAPSGEGAIGQRPLVQAIKSNEFRFYELNTGKIPGGGPYILTSNRCGDCTTLGSNIIPEFWID